MALLRLERASKVESSSFADVSVSGSLHLCTAIVLLCYRTTSGTCYAAKHLSVLLLALLSQPSTYASSCHWSYGKFFHTPCTPQSHSLPVDAPLIRVVYHTPCTPQSHSLPAYIDAPLIRVVYHTPCTPQSHSLPAQMLLSFE